MRFTPIAQVTGLLSPLSTWSESIAFAHRAFTGVHSPLAACATQRQIRALALHQRRASSSGMPMSLTVTLDPDIADALGVWIATHSGPKPNPEEAVSLALRDFLTGLGLLPFHDEPGQAH